MTTIDHESADVLSLTLQNADGQPLPTALPGQYVVVRLHPTAGGPPLFRSYSLSGAVSAERYRISVKIEPNGAAGTYLREHVRMGDALDVSAPRGSFILQSGDRPVVLLSAGIGATPMLAMLHALAAAARRGRSCGSTALAIGSIIPSPPKYAASCPRSRTAGATSVTASRPQGQDR